MKSSTSVSFIIHTMRVMSGILMIWIFVMVTFAMMERANPDRQVGVWTPKQIEGGEKK